MGSAIIEGDNKWHCIITNDADVAIVWDWCIDCSSLGRFDYVIEPLWDRAWWFEYEKDALIFALTWGHFII